MMATATMTKGGNTVVKNLTHNPKTECSHPAAGTWTEKMEKTRYDDGNDGSDTNDNDSKRGDKEDDTNDDSDNGDCNSNNSNVKVVCDNVTHNNYKQIAMMMMTIVTPELPRMVRPIA